MVVSSAVCLRRGKRSICSRRRRTRRLGFLPASFLAFGCSNSSKLIPQRQSKTHGHLATQK